MKKTGYQALAKKGDGVLVRRGNVWTYPAAEMDRSGTNLQLPSEHVGDAEVQDAIRSGELVVATTHPGQGAIAVRLKGDNDSSTAVVSAVEAGTPEAGTELPVNSRPSHDAGMRPGSATAAMASAAAGDRQNQKGIDNARADTLNKERARVAAIAAAGRDAKAEQTLIDQLIADGSSVEEAAGKFKSVKTS